jgi:hypothetical protein
MANGDQSDIFNRLNKNLVPWFGQNAPVKDALLQGIAETDSYIFQLISETNMDARILTATGEALDLISLDYFGGALPRKPGENDASFRNRILASLFQERATRKGMITVLTKLTGIVPGVIEGTNTQDAGAYDQSLFYDQYGGMGWLQPYTAIIYAFTPQPQGLLYRGGYDQASFGGFGYDFHFNNAYVDLSEEIVFVTAQDIINAIQQTKPYGTYMYIYIDGVYQPNAH